MITFLSLEPLLDFDVDILVKEIREIKPSFVSIGADSKNNNLLEPPADKIRELIQELEKFTSIKLKRNLSRLME